MTAPDSALWSIRVAMPWVVATLALISLAPVGAQEAVPRALPLEVRMPVLALETHVVAEADAAFDRDEPARALVLLERRLSSHPGDYPARWRAARASLVLGVLATDPETKVEFFERAVTHGDTAVALEPNGIDGLYWAAAATGRDALRHGPRTSTRMIQRLWDLTHRVLELDPEHPGAHNILGKLNQEVMSLSTLERVIGRLLFRIDPLREASWDRALDHHFRAVRADPSVVLFRMDLGVTWAELGCPDHAREQLELALGLPESYPVDGYFKTGMREVLADMAAAGEGSPHSSGERCAGSSGPPAAD